jgi:hypothetical protein
LLELLVVLTILVALAGILIPLLPNILGRSTTTIGATNVAEVDKHLHHFELLYKGYPNEFDALTDATGAAVADYVPNNVGQLSILTLTAEQANALRTSGITSLAEMQPNQAAFSATNDATFNPYTGPGNSIAIATGTKVVQVSEAAVEGLQGLVTDDAAHSGVNGADVYVLVGLGRRCTMCGRTITEPPLRFADSLAENPTQVYARIGLVFRVTRGGASPVLPRAVFVGAVEIGRNGITSVNSHLRDYYNLERTQ